MKTLQFYLDKQKLSNGDSRYMKQEVKDEIFSRTPDCKDGHLKERFHWLLYDFTEFPKCPQCAEFLSTANWCRQKHHYSKFCSLSCAALYRESDPNHKEKMFEKFGTAHLLSSEAVQAKRRATNIERYGSIVPHPWESDSHKKILVKKYGVESTRNIAEVDKKIILSHIERSKKILLEKMPQIEKEFGVSAISDPISSWSGKKLSSQSIMWRHKCGKEYESNITHRGIRTCPSCNASTSKLEQELLEIIKEITPATVINRDKDLIKPFEIDILIPSLKLAIEIDGSYWHSAKFQSGSKVLNKLKMCQEKGYKLITIQESVYRTRPLQVISRLRSALGQNQQKIFARNCRVIELTPEIKSIFFSRFHTAGDARSSVAIGLIHDGVVISAMSFGRPRFNRNYDWEIIRAACADNISIPGGVSKLISYFKNLYPGQSIITYADRCWGEGTSYAKAGFKFEKSTYPGYFYVGQNHQIIHRYQAQKKMLKNLLRDKFDEQLSESKNMENAGFLQIFDRGTNVYVLRP